MKKFWSLFFLLLFTTSMQAVNDNVLDPIQVSLLTCSSGTEIYNLFGHTALRCKNKVLGIDAVFNYGMFDFRKPHFILRFTMGKTDYELGVEDYMSFIENYQMQGRSVYEQVLNLNAVEKARLFQLLFNNYLPQNRTYRYNFLYDNCSTRPRDKIEQSIYGKIIYPVYTEKKSYRDIIHEYTKDHLWARFGIDLCLGAAADKDISQRQMMFCPFYLCDFVGKAKIQATSGVRPLMSGHNQLVIAHTTKKAGFLFTPIQTMLLLFVVVALFTIYGIRKRKSLWILDLVLFTIVGLAGCIIAFLMLFSTHPTVSSNLQILVLHPFYVLCLPWILFAERGYCRSLPLQIFCVVLTLFIAFFWLLPQKFDLAIVPLAASLLVRSMSNLILTYNKK